jgi:hypothetical protein
VEDAAYLRSRAELCLQMAQQMSDPKTAEGLRLTAAKYLAQAAQAENGSGPARAMRYYFKADYDGHTVIDDEGEEFSSLEAAKAHAATVAGELARNTPRSVTVFVLAEDGTVLATEPATKLA